MRTKTATRKSLTDQAAELVEQVQPHVEAARDRIVNEYLPVAQTVLADAAVAAREVAQDAREAAQEAAANAEKSTRKSRKRAAKKAKAKARDLTAAAAATATPAAVAFAEKVQRKPQKKSRKKRFVMLLGLVGIGTVVFKRLRGEQSGGTSYGTPSYTSTGPGTSTSTSRATGTPQAAPTMHLDPDAPGGAASDAVTDAGPGGTPDPAAQDVPPSDQGGSFFDEAIADAEEHPHRATTPDQPAETVDVEPQDAKKS